MPSRRVVARSARRRWSRSSASCSAPSLPRLTSSRQRIGLSDGDSSPYGWIAKPSPVAGRSAGRPRGCARSAPERGDAAVQPVREGGDGRPPGPATRPRTRGAIVHSATREAIVDNITLYWLTGTAASAARSYWEDARALAAALASGQAPPAVKVPVGFTTFPGEIWASPRSWVEAVYPGLAYFNEVDRGGHFAAWEEPELFTSEVRAAFRSLR